MFITENIRKTKATSLNYLEIILHKTNRIWGCAIFIFEGFIDRPLNLGTFFRLSI